MLLETQQIKEHPKRRHTQQREAISMNADSVTQIKAVTQLRGHVSGPEQASQHYEQQKCSL